MQAVVPDERPTIERTLAEWADYGEVGSDPDDGRHGLCARDITPEATLAVIERQAPGLAEAMRAAGLRATPHAMLSRGMAGIRGADTDRQLCPGSPKAAQEGLEVILPACRTPWRCCPEPDAESGHRPPPQQEGSLTPAAPTVRCRRDEPSS